MKLFLFTTLLCVVLPILSAQTVQWGPKLESQNFRKINFHTGNQLWAVGTNDGNHFVKKYENLQMTGEWVKELVASYSISLSLDASDLRSSISVNDINQVIQVVMLGDKQYAVIRSGGIFAGINWAISLVPIIDGKLESSKGITLISSNDKLVKGLPFIMKRIYVAVSPDGSKLAIGYGNKLTKIWDNANLSVVVVNNNLNLVGKGFFEYPYKVDADLSKFDGTLNAAASKVGETETLSLAQYELTKEDNMSISDFQVSNNGEILTLAKILKSEKVNKWYPYKYSLFRYDFKTKKLLELKTYDVPNYQEIGVGLYHLANDEYLLWGMYSEGHRYKDFVASGVLANTPSNSLIGTFSEKINTSTWKSSESQESLIDKNILANLSKDPKKTIKKIESKGIEDYGLTIPLSPIIKNDGGMVAVTSLAWTVPKAVVNGVQTYAYEHDGAVIFNLDEKGKILNYSELKLSQKCKEKGRARYGITYKVFDSGKIVFLYSDHPKNVDINAAKMKTFKGGKKSNFVMTTFEQGKFTNKVIDHNKPNDNVPKLFRVYWTDNRVYLYSNSKIGYRMGSVDL